MASVSPVYPNIVPENNLRLPDALTIKYGPAPLLADFCLAGDMAARRQGIQLRLRHDFGELVYLNAHQVAVGNWYPLLNMFHPERSDVSPENAFYIAGEDEHGDVVATYAARIYYWPDTNLKEQAVAMLYGRDEGQACVITAPAATDMTGVVMSVGAAWVRPDHRRQQLSQLLPRMAKAYAISRWPLDWAIGYVTRPLVDKGVAAGYGSKHFSYSVYYPELDFGELVLAYTSAGEAYDDLASFLPELSHFHSSKLATGASSSTSLAQELTKISVDGVFHGSSRRS
jgi:hypothetical protein